MDLSHLRYYIEVVDNQSYTKAAEKMQVTQPMLTRVIKQIEEELNVKLIERNSKYFRHTDAGKAFYNESKEILLRFEGLYSLMDDIKSPNAGHVRLSLTSVFMDTYFAKLLIEFQTLYPNISISLVDEGSKKIVEAILAEQIDLGIVMLPVPNQSQLNVINLLRDACQVFVAKSHPLASQDCVHITDLKNERIITFGETSILHDIFVRNCEESGFLPNIAYKCSTPIFTFDMVATGLCVGLWPYPIIRRFITEEITTLPMEPVIPWVASIISKKDRYQSFATRNLMKFIQAYLSKLEP